MDLKENKDGRYLHKLEKIIFQPVFILGLHRSGTSILYKMLNKTDCFNVVTAYHLIRFNELLYHHINNNEKKAKEDLQEYFFEIGIGKREIDNLKVTPDFAEEYGFLLTNLGYPGKINDKNIHIFNKLCKKIQFISENEKPILLKNPPDFSNFLFIKKKIPNAKFVFIHRNPISVINSKMNAWRVLLEKKNPYTSLLSKDYEKNFKIPLVHRFLKFYFSTKCPFGFLKVINESANDVNFYLDHVDELNSDDYVTIRYEDLCSNPNKTINDILNFIDCKSDADFRDYIKPRNLNIPPEIKKKQDTIIRKMRRYCEYFNYV